MPIVIAGSPPLIDVVLIETSVKSRVRPPSCHCIVAASSSKKMVSARCSTPISASLSVNVQSKRCAAADAARPAITVNTSPIHGKTRIALRTFTDDAPASKE